MECNAVQCNAVQCNPMQLNPPPFLPTYAVYRHAAGRLPVSKLHRELGQLNRLAVVAVRVFDFDSGEAEKPAGARKRGLDVSLSKSVDLQSCQVRASVSQSVSQSVDRSTKHGRLGDGDNDIYIYINETCSSRRRTARRSWSHWLQTAKENKASTHYNNNNNHQQQHNKMATTNPPLAHAPTLC